MIEKEMKRLAKIELKASSKPIEEGVEKEAENADESFNDLSDENEDQEREK